ncbi:MAG TPA: pyridoxamine 5'-phosphate oxidase family protein [Ferrovibrio sp.]|uniref:pyridoxamine 5'-phosphate oxidase family protein n=1 Tax=Ferrovibrio sp. TaxID=1917215 RepID=UPI002ED6BE07
MAEVQEAFHAGEQAMQLLAGVRERMAEVGQRVIRDFMPDQHRELFEKLPYLLAGSRDTYGRPWASLLVGRPGFVRTPDAQTMRIAARPAPNDPLTESLRPGAALGLLGIELHTRRRNRMNGRITAVEDGAFTLHVDQSFGNCPQYIQARRPRFVDLPETFAQAHPWQEQGPLLSADAAALAAQADTFFIATASAEPDHGGRSDGVDISHRGGRPGFVRITEEAGRSVLAVPDYAGNLYFNTLGNIAINPKAGLLFIDFDSGNLLALTGAASVILDDPLIAAFQGAQRLLRFEPEAGYLLRGAVPLRWTEPDYAPQLARTGSWETAAAALKSNPD